jgi:hypothetical protein
MKLVTKALSFLALVGAIALIAQWAWAAGVEGRSYSYETIYTPDNPVTDTGCGHFVPGGTLLLDINGDGFEGTWRQRRFRGLSFFKAKFDAYGDSYNVTGVMPYTGFMVGSATYLDDDGLIKLVKWQAVETDCVPIPAP